MQLHGSATAGLNFDGPITPVSEENRIKINSGSTHLIWEYEEFSFQFFIPACHLPSPGVCSGPEPLKEKFSPGLQLAPCARLLGHL